MTYKSSYDRGAWAKSLPRSWYTAGPAPVVPGRGLSKKDRDLYQAIHVAWGAGIVSGDWGLFAPEPDAEPEWWLDGLTFPHDARDAVRGHLARLMFAAGVVALEWGPMWLGRRDVIVTRIAEEVAA